MLSLKMPSFPIPPWFCMCCSLLEVIPLPSVKRAFAYSSSKTSFPCSTTILSLRTSSTSLHLLHFCLPWTYLPWGHVWLMAVSSASGAVLEPRRYPVFAERIHPLQLWRVPPCPILSVSVHGVSSSWPGVGLATKHWQSCWGSESRHTHMCTCDLPEIKALSTKGSMMPTPLGELSALRIHGRGHSEIGTWGL